MKRIYILTALLVSPLAMSAMPSFNKEIDLQNKQDKQRTINAELEKSREAGLRDAAQSQTVPNSIVADAKEKKFLLTNIIINTGDQKRYSLDIRPFVQPYLGTMIGKSTIFSLIRDLNNYLSSKGFVTSAVSITPTNLNKGVLKLNILWGKVDGFLVNGKPVSSFSDRMLIRQAIPISSGDVLNMHDIDQGVENINNYANKSRIDILPSTKNGYSFLNLILSKSEQPAFSLSMDNSGSGTSSKGGLYRYTAGVNISNVLFGSDTLGLSANTRHFRSDGGRYNYFAGLTYDVPVDYTKFSLQANTSDSGQPMHGEVNDYTSNSDGQTYSGRVTQLLLRNATDKLSAYTNLQRKRTKNFVNGIMTDVNSHPYTDMSLGIQYVTNIFGGGVFSDLSYNRGLSLLDGEKAGYDEKGNPTNYDRLVFELSWQPNFSFANHNFSYSSHLSGQYSRYHLLDMNRLTVGDEYTVRGFKDDNFYGDKGVVLSNTLSMLTEPFHDISLTPFIGLDGSYLKNIKDSDNYATGAAVGVKSSYKIFDNSLTVGVPLRHSELATKTDSYVAYWNVSASF